MEIEKITLEDGRLAEKRVSHNGSEKIVEIYAEAVRPMELEQRVIERKQEVLAERIIEKIDGDKIVARETHAIDGAETKLKMKEENNFATKSDVVEAVSEAMRCLMDDVAVVEQPAIKAQSIIEGHIDKKSGKSTKGIIITTGLAIVIGVQAVLVYMYAF